MRLDGHHPAGRVVDELEPELAVDLGFVLRSGGGEHAEQVAEAAHQGGQLVAGHALAPLAGCPLQLDLGREALGLDLGNPGAHDCRVGAGLECSAVAGEAGVALDHSAPRRLGFGLTCVVGRAGGGFQRVEGGVELAGVEHLGEPAVERSEDLVLAHVDVLRVVELVGHRVLARVAATVVGSSVVGASLH
ncbi:MAG: hypothetical protein ACRDZY_13745, partial [Acidimicrobiales bacterium]